MYSPMSGSSFVSNSSGLSFCTASPSPVFSSLASPVVGNNQKKKKAAAQKNTGHGMVSHTHTQSGRLKGGEDTKGIGCSTFLSQSRRRPEQALGDDQGPRRRDNFRSKTPNEIYVGDNMYLLQHTPILPPSTVHLRKRQKRTSSNATRDSSPFVVAVAKSTKKNSTQSHLFFKKYPQ